MSNSVSVIFFEKVFLFLKNSGTSGTSIVFIKKVSSHFVPFVPLSGLSIGTRDSFWFLKTEKYWENYHGQLAVAVPLHPLHKKAPIVSGGEIDRGVKSTEC